MDGHPSQVARMRPEQVAALIQSALPDATIDVRSGDDVHFTARVVSQAFAGKRPLQRHQLVYQALGALMGGEIHALSIEALTPEEA
jgi:acid stress-induced BolA-like protein IbaG/YrbA